MDFRGEPADVSQIRRAVPENCGKGHSVNVAGRGSFRRVHVAVRIEPDDSDPVFVLVVIGGESRHAAYRYRMVSTEDDRDRASSRADST